MPQKVLVNLDDLRYVTNLLIQQKAPLSPEIVRLLLKAGPPPKTIVGLRLKSFGDRKIQVIKAVRLHTGYGLKDSKHWVESEKPEWFSAYPEAIQEMADALIDAGASFKYIYN